MSSIAVSYLTLVVPGKSFTAIWPVDVFGLLDAAYRCQQGQIPYNDFYFFHGPLVAVIPALGLSFGLEGGVIFGFDSVIVGALVLLAAAVAMSRRLTLAAAVIVFVFVWLLIAVPMAEGHNFRAITWGTFYNRHCWAALIVILLFYVEPECSRARDKWLDVGALSILVLFEIYTKFTFGAIALGFVIANSAVSKYNRQVSIGCLAFMALAVVILEAVFHFHLAYWHDVVEFASKLGQRTPVVSLLVSNIPIILACVGALFAIRATGRSSVFDSLFVIGCIVANMLVRASVGDNRSGQLVALVSVFVCLGELARRAETKRLASAPTSFQWEHHWVSLGCLFLALIFVSTETGNRILALGDYFVKVVHPDGRVLKIDTLPGTPLSLANFLVDQDDEPDLFDLVADNTLMRYRNAGPSAVKEFLTPEEYMRTIIEGSNLLRSVDYRNRTVFTFDIVNPFSYALNMRPSINGYPLFWFSFYKDATLAPQPQALIGAADFVMVPRLPFSVTQLTAMMNLYGPYLKENYVLSKGSSHWELWTRNRGNN
jgi:hypothetical protein